VTALDRKHRSNALDDSLDEARRQSAPNGAWTKRAAIPILSRP
jgi:hypothetical protein